MGPAHRRDDRDAFKQLRFGDRLSLPPSNITRIAAEPFPGEPGGIDAAQRAIGRVVPPVGARVSPSPHPQTGMRAADRRAADGPILRIDCRIGLGRISLASYRCVPRGG